MNALPSGCFDLSVHAREARLRELGVTEPGHIVFCRHEGCMLGVDPYYYPEMLSRDGSYDCGGRHRVLGVPEYIPSGDAQPARLTGVL